jgi:hypothetical protein
MRLAMLTLACEYLVIVYGHSNMTSSVNAHLANNHIDFRDEVDDFPTRIENLWNNFVEKVVPRKLYVLLYVTSF